MQVPVHGPLLAGQSGKFVLASFGNDGNVDRCVKTGSRRHGALPDQFQQTQVAKMAENIRASCPRNLTILSSPERFKYGFV
jgi:hypothetical protein